MVKNPPANAGDPGSIPGLGGSHGEGRGTHSSIFAWEIPWTDDLEGYTVHGVTKESNMI